MQQATLLTRRQVLKHQATAALAAAAVTSGVGSRTIAHIAPLSAANGTASQQGHPFFDVTAYGAKGNGITDDTTAILNAYAAARAAVGGTVLFPPGTYLISQPIAGSYGFTNNPEPAVSLVAMSSAGHLGDYLYPSERAAVELVASSTFPLGRFLIDYRENDTQGGPSGARIQGLSLSCNKRAAGFRAVGPREFHISDLTIIQAATPTVAERDKPQGAFSITSFPDFSTAGAWNLIEHLTIESAASCGIHHNCPSEDLFVAIFVQNCDLAGIKLDTASICTIIGGTQTGSQTGWHIQGWTGTIVGVGTEINGNLTNAVQLYGSINDTHIPTIQRFIGCEFGNNPASGTNEHDAAIVRCYQTAARPQNAVFIACEFVGNTAGTTTDYIEVDDGVIGSVEFTNCQFHGGYTNHAYNDTSGNAVLVMRDNRGINPVGTLTVSVPASGAATSPLAVDATFYITAAAGGCTVAISEGPTITVPASQICPVQVPAGHILTAAFTNAPSWVVEGE
jgi:hypothetical protein